MSLRLSFMIASSLALFSFGSGCSRANGPHVRFAEASSAEIENAQRSGEIIWYDFEPGDSVPIVFGLVGVSEAVSETPVRWVARRRFSVVVYPDGRTLFSFDGRRLVPGNIAAAWSLGLGAGEQGGEATLLLFIGEQQDLPRELQ